MVALLILTTWWGWNGRQVFHAVALHELTDFISCCSNIFTDTQVHTFCRSSSILIGWQWWANTKQVFALSPLINLVPFYWRVSSFAVSHVIFLFIFMIDFIWRNMCRNCRFVAIHIDIYIDMFSFCLPASRHTPINSHTEVKEHKIIFSASFLITSLVLFFRFTYMSTPLILLI